MTTEPCYRCGTLTKRYPDDDPDEGVLCTVCFDERYAAQTTEKYGTAEEKHAKEIEPASRVAIREALRRATS